MTDVASHNGLSRRRGSASVSALRVAARAAALWLGLWGALGALGAWADWAWAASPAASPRVVSQTDAEVVLRFEAPSYSLDTLVVPGRIYTRINAPGLSIVSQQGLPCLPLATAVVAVPPGGSARLVSVDVSGETVLEGLRIVPVEHAEQRTVDGAAFADFAYTEEESIYGGVGLFPAEAVWLADRGRLRHQDVVRVFASPFRYDAAGQRLHVAQGITVKIGFDYGEGEDLLRGTPPGEDAWEGLYRDVVLNYDQAKRWRSAGVPLLGAPQVGSDRVKITISKTGIHRLAFDTLASIGFPTGIRLERLFVYQDTFEEGYPDRIAVEEIAIAVVDGGAKDVFSEGDTIEFYARDFYDHYGRQGSQDAFADRDVCWLSWGPGEHRRLTSRPGWREVGSPQVVTSFPDLIHVEEDSLFVLFPPETDMDLFVWTGRRRIEPFALPGLAPSSAASLVVRFVNYFNDDNLYRSIHTSNIRLYMTGCAGIETPVDTVSTDFPSATVFTVPVPAGFLCEDRNRFRFESSILDALVRPGNALDWFEVQYRRRLEALDETLAFTNATVSGEVQFEVSGFSTRDIAVYDVSDPARPVLIDVPPERITFDGQAYTVALRDSVGPFRRYLAHGASAVTDLTSDALALRPPAQRDLSADYVVITHPGFAADLAPLVALRENQGHSAMVATTDQVYDDFGNGLKSDVAIRRFVKQAYASGDAAFVLLVGDANIDRRGVLRDPPPGQQPSDIDYVPSHALVRIDDLDYNKEIRPSDAWYANVDSAGDEYPDVYIGRFPVGSSVETAGIVSKIISFEAAAGDAASWKKRLLLVADDSYSYRPTNPERDCWSAQDGSFVSSLENIAAAVTANAVVVPDTVKYYLERCTKDDQPEKRCGAGCCTSTFDTQTFTRGHCTPALLDLLRAGALVANYQGHANRNQMTHEQLIYDGTAYGDFRGLTNRDRPFVFVGIGCWISDFMRQAEGGPSIGDAIGERVIVNPNGGACASFASGCSEIISTNAAFNPLVANALFTNLTRFDPHGQMVPARMLLGEALLTALVRFGQSGYAQRHVLFGDPAMVMDMGPPLVSVTVNDSLIDRSYVFDEEEASTLTVVSEIKDEEAIMKTGVELDDGTTVRQVPSIELGIVPLSDPGFPRSRAYRMTYAHVPALGDYLVRTVASDLAGKETAFDFRVRTGSAVFYKDEAVLAENGNVVLGQRLAVELKRPYAFTETDIVAMVDSVPASAFDDYLVVKQDAEGKEWQVSFTPSLESGDHVFKAAVKGFQAQRAFVYAAVRFDIRVDGRTLFNNDFIAGDARAEIVVTSGTELGEEDISVRIDGLPVSVDFEPDSTRTQWRGFLELGQAAATPGEHTLRVDAGDWNVTVAFRMAEETDLIDVSVFPNPFSGQTYFFYTLSDDATEVKLAVFTVAGRRIFDATLPAFAGYNQFTWYGYDRAGDRVANGAYIYRITVESGSGAREFTGRLVKID